MPARWKPDRGRCPPAKTRGSSGQVTPRGCSRSFQRANTGERQTRCCLRHGRTRQPGRSESRHGGGVGRQRKRSGRVCHVIVPIERSCCRESAPHSGGKYDPPELARTNCERPIDKAMRVPDAHSLQHPWHSSIGKRQNPREFRVIAAMYSLLQREACAAHAASSGTIADRDGNRLRAGDRGVARPSSGTVIDWHCADDGTGRLDPGEATAVGIGGSGCHSQRFLIRRPRRARR